MATDMFIKIDGIKGESQDDKHKDEIDLLSWSWGAVQPGIHGLGGGGGSGKVQFHDLSFNHYVDKSSPNLFQACAEGRHIPTAQLVVRKAGKEQQEYYIVKLNDLLISSVSTSGAEASNTLPVESVSINFSKFELDYKMQKKDGTLDAAVHGGWDIKANKKA